MLGFCAEADCSYDFRGARAPEPGFWGRDAGGGGAREGGPEAGGVADGDRAD